MDKKELLRLLADLARKDLAEGANLEDHPCTLAAYEILNMERDTAIRCKEIAEQRVYAEKPAENIAAKISVEFGI